MKNALASLLAGSLLSSHSSVLPSETGAGNWLLLIPPGTFSGRDGRGPFHAGDRASLEQIAERTRKYAGDTDIAIDYEHQAHHALQNGKPAPASGWVKEIDVREDGIYGRVEWTANAATAIKAKEYRYISPVFYHDKAGKILALQMVSLTNTPNLDLAEVSAHSLIRNFNQEAPMKKVLAALGLTDGTSEDDVVVAINSLLTSSTAIAVAAGLTKDAKSEEILTAINSVVADRKRIAGALGKAETAAGDEIILALNSALTSANPDPTKWVPIEQVRQLQADVTTLKADAAAEKAEEAVAQAIKDGKLVPALKDWGISLHNVNPKAFQDFVGASPVLTANQRLNPKPADATAGGLDDGQAIVVAAMGVDPEAFKKTLAAEAAEREAR